MFEEYETVLPVTSWHKFLKLSDYSAKSKENPVDLEFYIKKQLAGPIDRAMNIIFGESSEQNFSKPKMAIISSQHLANYDTKTYMANLGSDLLLKVPHYLNFIPDQYFSIDAFKTVNLYCQSFFDPDKIEELLQIQEYHFLRILNQQGDVQRKVRDLPAPQFFISGIVKSSCNRANQKNMLVYVEIEYLRIGMEERIEPRVILRWVRLFHKYIALLD